MDPDKYKHTFMRMSSILLVVPVYFPTSVYWNFGCLSAMLTLVIDRLYDFCQWRIWSSVLWKCLFISFQAFGFLLFWSYYVGLWCIFLLGCISFHCGFMSYFYIIDASSFSFMFVGGVFPLSMVCLFLFYVVFCWIELTTLT